MPKTYTVKDTTTGKTITFRWDDPTPPTDADFEEVFKEAGSFNVPEPPSPGQKAWEGYKSVVGMAGAPARFLQGKYSEYVRDPARDLMGNVGLGGLAESVLPENLGGFITGGAIGRELQKKLPGNLRAVAQAGQGAVDELFGDPVNALPITNRAAGAAFAPAAGSAAMEGLAEATAIYQSEGASPKFWDSLTRAGISTAFFGAILLGLKKGKAPTEAVKAATSEGSAPKAAVGSSTGAVPTEAVPLQYPPAGQVTAQVPPRTPTPGRVQPGTATEVPPNMPVPDVQYGVMPGRVPSAVRPTPPPIPEADPTYSGRGDSPMPGSNQYRIPFAQEAPPPEPGPSIEQRFSEMKMKPFNFGALKAMGGPDPLAPAPEVSPLQDAVMAADDAVGAPVDLSSLPAVAPDHTRLYRGEGANQIEGSDWFTTEAPEAASYDPNLLYVDVPTRWLELKNENLGRDPSMRGEFQLPGGYVARAKPVIDKTKWAGQEGFAINPAAPIMDLLTGVSKLLGAGKSNLRKGVSFLDDYLRVSVAGGLEQFARNTTSAVKMTGQNYIMNPLAAQAARARAGILRAQGRPQEAMEALRSAEVLSEMNKSFGNVAAPELAATVVDMVNMLKGKDISPSGTFGENLKVLEEFGLQKEATSLRNFSTPETKEGIRPGDTEAAAIMKKVGLALNIMGDRATNRVYIASTIDALQKVFGVNSPQALAALANDPSMRSVIKNYLEYGSTDAARVAWNQPWVTSGAKVEGGQIIPGKGSKLQSAFRVWGDIPVVGVLTQPFARAFAANYLPNIVESFPGLHLLSKRVQNSYAHHAMDRLHKETLAELKSEPAGTKKHVDLEKALASIATKMREVREGGIYNVDMIHARTVVGPVLTTAAAAWRIMRGDDGTEFDEFKLGEAPRTGEQRNAGFGPQLGEWMPYFFFGDYIGHWLLAHPESAPEWMRPYLEPKRTPNFKYEGKAGMLQPERLAQSFYGSRYSYTSAGSELLSALFDSTFRGKDLDSDYLKEMTMKVVGEAGRMAGGGAWLGSAVRGAAAATDPEEAISRRSDLSMTAGFQSQVPGWRKELPPSIQWLKLREGERSTPLGSMLSGVATSDRSRLEEFINRHQGVLKVRDVSPRRSGDPEFDREYLDAFSRLVRGKILPMMDRPEWQAKSEEEKVAEFTSAMKAAREAAKRLALGEYREDTGTLPEEEIEKQANKKETKERERLKKGAPQFPKRRTPKASREEIQQFLMKRDE